VLAPVLAVAAFFVVADFVYVVDHYFVHHDADRYARRHARHHDRYAGARTGRHLDAYELATYGRAAAVSVVVASGVSVVTGNAGFALGAVLKYVHSLLFHLYQHRWWSAVRVAEQPLASPPGRGWGLATSRYHAFHHARPGHPVFTFAESWQGFDRILERLHPWLVRVTADARRVRAGSRSTRSMC
jgi:hypothetical protein